MEIKAYKSLPEEAKHIRNAVFVDEQGFTDEFDDIDSLSKHLVAFVGGIAAATARIYLDKSENRYIIGRIAVMKQCRGKGLGSEIIKAAEKEIVSNGGNTAYIHAQMRAVGFYEKLGYVKIGEMEPEQGYPHVWMKKSII